MSVLVEWNIDALHKCLKAVQELRASVSFVFEKLNDGIATPPCRDEKEKHVVSELREYLSKVNADMEELEKNSAAVSSSGSTLSLGNLGLLMADPTIDKTPLHSQVMTTYKWASQVHDHSSIACTIFHNSATKRSLGSASSLASKRQRRYMVNSLNAQPIDMVVQNFMRLFPDVAIALERPFGSSAVLQVTIGRTAKALVVLRGLVLEWVIIRAYHEDLRLDNGKLDLWSPSRYSVFQKVTSHARSALLHFYAPHTGSLIDPALKSFLMWLQSYKNLFSSSCIVCGQLLQGTLPPTWRDFRTLDTYHEQCLWKQ